VVLMFFPPCVVLLVALMVLFLSCGPDLHLALCYYPYHIVLLLLSHCVVTLVALVLLFLLHWCFCSYCVVMLFFLHYATFLSCWCCCLSTFWPNLMLLFFSCWCCCFSNVGAAILSLMLVWYFLSLLPYASQGLETKHQISQ
jgi:hypothetical protein